MYSTTKTNTYTVADIRWVLLNFAADFSMIAQATGLRSKESVAETVVDLIGLAIGGFLEVVDIILWDANDVKLRAVKFAVSTNAEGWVSQRPGNNLWPKTPGGSLQVIATLSTSWWELTESGRNRVRESLGIKGMWSLTNVDTSHHDLTSMVDRSYAKNGYGLQKTLYQQ